MLPYDEVWAYNLGRSQYSTLPSFYLCRACASLTFPRLVLKVVTFYGKFSLYEPNIPAYNLSIRRLDVVRKNNNTQRAILTRNLYDTELALYYLDGQE